MKFKSYRIFFLVLLMIGLTLFITQAQQNNEDLSEFLKSTHFIDSDNPIIIAKAKELTKGCTTETEKARALFEFVRDSYNDNPCASYIASETLECGGNSCRRRSILLTALCRAAGIPARLHLQKVTIKNWKNEDGTTQDLTFAHGLTGIYINGNWHLYESVGNVDKWIIWVQDENRASEVPVKFHPDQDCLFPLDGKILIETLPIHFADRREEMIKLIEKIDKYEY
jgi:transglutaminase-like putative cysteine protease